MTTRPSKRAASWLLLLALGILGSYLLSRLPSDHSYLRRYLLRLAFQEALSSPAFDKALQTLPSLGSLPPLPAATQKPLAPLTPSDLQKPLAPPTPSATSHPAASKVGAASRPSSLKAPLTPKPPPSRIALLCVGSIDTVGDSKVSPPESPCPETLLFEIRRKLGSRWLADRRGADGLIVATIRQGVQGGIDLRLSLRPNRPMAEEKAGITSTQALIRWTALLPPFLAIFFVLLTRRVLLSLLLSLLIGVGIAQGGNIPATLYHASYSYIWQKGIFQEFSFNIIFFTFSLIGMVNLCSRNGGIQGMIERLRRYASTPRSSRLMTGFLGILIFFDDYANSIIVGNTMRPMTDRYRVSREKLAYLIDSTAAPIAGIALLSTWIGYEVGLLSSISQDLSLTVSGYNLFLSSLPFRFYCWMTILFLFLGIAVGRDYGPMLKAERRAWEEGKLIADGSTPLIKEEMEYTEPPPTIPRRAINVLLPILVVLLAGFLGLLISGGYFQGKSLRDAVSDANNTRVFLIAALLGSALAILLTLAQRLLSFKDTLLAWLSGAKAISFAVGILIFAWSIAALSKDLGTAPYIISIFPRDIRPEWLPFLIFCIASLVSFATGTSYGTMGILLPLAGPLAYAQGGLPILILSVGAVLDGAIFGDHCSPLSDTTLFSSAAAACDHVDHVQTQLPYALSVMLVSSTVGYIAVAHGLSIFASALLAFLLFLGFFFLLGQPSNPPKAGHLPS